MSGVVEILTFTYTKRQQLLNSYSLLRHAQPPRVLKGARIWDFNEAVSEQDPNSLLLCPGADR